MKSYINNQQSSESFSFQRSMQRIMANILFPTIRRDWYAYKGYKTFEEYAESMFSKKAIGNYVVKKGWENIKAERNFVMSQDVRGNFCKLDSISLSSISKNDKLPGDGKHILNFLGSFQFYEGFVPSMIKQQIKSGATIHAFNYPGMYSSSGEVLEFNDLVNSGIAMVNNLLQKGIKPDDIILQGNCMGAAVAEAVATQFRAQNVQLRVVNSNSFKSMKSLILEKFHIPSLLSNLVDKLLHYTGWKITPAKQRQGEQYSPYHMILSRAGDKTIPLRSQMISSKKYSNGNDSLFENYKEEFKLKLEPHLELKHEDTFLTEEQRKAFAELSKLSGSKVIKDPHLAPSEGMYSARDQTKNFYDIVNTYLQISEKYINNHKQVFPAGYIPMAPFILKTEEQVISYDEEKKMSALADIIQALHNDYYEEESENKLTSFERKIQAFVNHSFMLYQQLYSENVAHDGFKEYSNFSLAISRIEKKGSNTIMALSDVLEGHISHKMKPNSYNQFVVDLLLTYLTPERIEGKSHATGEDLQFLVETLRTLNSELQINAIVTHQQSI
ncbi:Dot/Icm T4SS effector alpha/beta hydrolase [Legionella hackeliae]|uniref:Putative SdbB protein (Putative substrate of the Dot/Icm system) n=1 Tax=Legionella hackeliae TaxID=449 RepID=A0A0A8UTC5_LEGHA|nr:Dot/Icm T4SS effector alpha/beta hydrolase [Legionella hackeliae]KTD06647.1 SdbB protein (substrate of the Dot/Icm system) [Legionella hackeliae]CEK10766.1 putative SdbB protein (Putative substrate of the Dot/Icm system) [Legionella hackeliae]STX47505.1 SdbB protein [Legionella hackeliae]